MHNDVTALPIYYAVLDNVTSTFVKRMHPPLTTLIASYVEAVIVSANLG